MSTTTIKKLTPVLYVQAIEPCLPLWVDRLGWTAVAKVPHGDVLGFVILVKDGVELMYQTWDSATADVGGAVARGQGASTGLFIEVESLNAVQKQLEGVALTVPRRKTAYGMDEIGIEEPGGHMVLFAQPVAD